MSQKKTCTRCQTEKPLSDFDADKRQRDGRFSWCRVCCRTEFVKRREARKAKGETVSHKVCKECGQDKPADAYAKDWGHGSGLQPRCKDCRRILDTLAKYNLSREDYDRMLSEQGGKCAICLRDPEGSLHVDHDHSCCAYNGSCGRCVRGLVCGPCNRAIGLLGDDPDRLRRAAAYITTHRLRADGADEPPE